MNRIQVITEQPSARWHELDEVGRSLTRTMEQAEQAGLRWLSLRLLALKLDVLQERERS